MNNHLKLELIESKILHIRNQNVILDSDIAKLYGVETRDIIKAVRNNLEKFPEGYVFELQNGEKMELVENSHRFNTLKHSTENIEISLKHKK